MLTKLDKYVKERMLGYPSMFPTRIEVLMHVYLVFGNGCKWGENGCLLEYLDSTTDFTKMDYSDLKELLRDAKDRARDLKMDKSFRIEEIQNKIDKRKYIAKNIKKLSSTITPDDFVFKYRQQRKGYNHPTMVIEMVSHPSGSIRLSDMPRVMEKSFFDGAIEVLDVVIRSAEDPDQKEQLLAYRKSLFTVHTTY